MWIIVGGWNISPIVIVPPATDQGRIVHGSGEELVFGMEEDSVSIQKVGVLGP